MVEDGAAVGSAGTGIDEAPNDSVALADVPIAQEWVAIEAESRRDAAAVPAGTINGRHFAAGARIPEYLSKCAYYTSAGPNVKRFDVCSNTQLADFNSVPLPAGSETCTVRLLPSGGLLVAAMDAIVQYDAGGNVAAKIDALRENCW